MKCTRVQAAVLLISRVLVANLTAEIRSRDLKGASNANHMSHVSQIDALEKRARVALHEIDALRNSLRLVPPEVLWWLSPIPIPIRDW